MHNLFQGHPGNALITTFLQEIDFRKINAEDAARAIVTGQSSGRYVENEHANHHQPT